MAIGAIHPTFAKLERQKLVKSLWAPGSAGTADCDQKFPALAVLRILIRARGFELLSVLKWLFVLVLSSVSLGFALGESDAG